MNIVIINDCRDANAMGRQKTRIMALTNSPANSVGVSNDLEASGNLIDCLDAIEGHTGAILVNVAPRSGAAKKWKNGTPFGYFWYQRTLVVTSVDGYTLSLIKKLNIVPAVNVLDIPETLDIMNKNGDIPKDLVDHITNTQFRSYDFLPRITAYLLNNKGILSTQLPMAEIPEIPKTVWWVDNFGNCKTTCFQEELDIKNGKVNTKFGELNFYDRLKDVPDHEPAVIVGSSGFGNKRFVEIVVQGKSAADHFKIKAGDIVF